MIDLAKPLIGVWQVPLPNGDWLAAAWVDGTEAFMVYRFRYYDRKNPGHPSDPDPRSWWTWRGGTHTTADDLYKVADHIAAAVAAKSGSEVDFVDMRSCRSDEDRMTQLLTRPWVHLSPTAPSGDA